MLSSDAIAKICHEANRALCESLGDYSQPVWEEAPQWQTDSAISGVGFHLNTLSSGGQHPPSASHEAWYAQKLDDGWVYGEVKDPAKKEHPCMVPYEQLPRDQQVKDYVFGAIVKAVYDCYFKEEEND